MTLRCGLIGCGGVVQDLHLPAWGGIDDLVIAALCDPNEANLNQVSRRLGVTRIYTQVDRFLDENRDLDFVSVATPGFTHYDIAGKVMEHGLNLLLEKPVALSLKEALDLQARAERAKIVFGVVQNYRFRDCVLTARRDLEAGRIGRIYQVNTTFHGESLYNEPSPWMWEERRHRTLLYEVGVHFLDLQTYFAGPMARVLAVKVQADEHLGCVTAIYALVEHQNGAVGMIDLQWFASSNYTQCQLFGTANDATLKFYPEGYSLYSGRVNPIDEVYIAYQRTLNFVWPTLREKLRPPRVHRRAMSHYRLFSGFVQGLRDGSGRIPVSIADAMPTMELLEALAIPAYGPKGDW